jgi:sialate O-acetylesterase
MMKKTIIQTLAFALFLFLGITAAKAFSGTGAGTDVSPYEITTVAQLDEVRNATGVNVYYKLMNDIDLTDWITANAPTAGWNPLPFAGHFNGNGHFISGLKINRTTSNVGLFGSVTANAEISNLGVATAENDTVTGAENAGILVGGISGTGVTLTVKNCAVLGNVRATSKNVGAFLGFNNNGNITLENSYAAGSVVSAGDGAGGLIGNSWSGSGAVSCNVTIQKSYAINSVSSTGAAGGLLGGASSSGSTSMGKQAIMLNISNAYAVNPSITTTTTSCGRIYGYLKTANATLTLNNFAFAKTLINDIAVSGTTDNNNGENKSAGELAAQATYETIGWDFTDDWTLGNGDYELPVLKSLPLSLQPTAPVLVEPPLTLTLPSILSDNMVLQRNTSVRLWGKAAQNRSVHIVTGWDGAEQDVSADAEGLWETTVSTGDAGGPYSITFSSEGLTKTVDNILLGEVWICAGQSNMNMPLQGWDGMPVENSANLITASASYSDIRMFTANRITSPEEQFNVNGSWQTAATAASTFSAVGYLYALELREKLGVPVGMVHISWPGSTIQAWMSRDVLQLYPEVNLNISGNLTQRTPTALYNAMFHPIAKHTVKGVIWYQGEENVGAHALYAKLFPAFVRNWRSDVGLGDIPFYYVELAPHKYQGSTQNLAALLREVQFQSQDSLVNVAMVTTGDLGEENQIHPAKKQEIAQRLAYYSLLNTYGFNEAPYTQIYTPVATRKSISGNTISLIFDRLENGLVLQGDPTSAFEIAGDDNVYYTANAQVTESEIKVWSNSVANPKNVHYAFRNYVPSVLFNSYGIPVAPFRTDNLPLDPPTALAAIEEDNRTVYPNPAKDRIFINPFPSIGQLQIYDIAGRKMTTGKSPDGQSIDISHLPAGVYSLVVNGKPHLIIKQ